MHCTGPLRNICHRRHKRSPPLHRPASAGIESTTSTGRWHPRGAMWSHAGQLYPLSGFARGVRTAVASLSVSHAKSVLYGAFVWTGRGAQPHA
jgi:hypothetical protein